MRSLTFSVIYSLFIFSKYCDRTVAVDSALCGNWESYKDEKCFLILGKVTNHDDAIKTCSQQASTLIHINSKDEQVFLSNLLFKTHKIIENVWIGAKYTSNKVSWEDNSDSRFTNWAEENPKNESGYNCIQMLAEGSSMGKWFNEPCTKNNLVVCQKLPVWSLSQMQKSFLELRKNPVPLGFTYVQLPNLPEPSTLWSIVEWKDITSDYAGVFFRAEGGGSAKFGQTQNENSPRLSGIETQVASSCNEGGTAILPGKWSPYMLTGKYETTVNCLRLFVSPGEVRPRNMAVRVWMRVG